MAEIKAKHGEIIGLEERQKKIQNSIKAQKDKGYTPQESKQAIENAQEQTESAHVRLEIEIKEIEQTKQTTAKNNKEAMLELDQRLSKVRNHVKLLECQLKEKDSELKLVDLKVRELKK